MSNWTLEIKCGRCGGTGIDHNHTDENGEIVPEPCASCGGDGYIGSGIIDVTDLETAITKLLRRTKKILDHFEISDED